LQVVSGVCSLLEAVRSADPRGGHGQITMNDKVR